LGSGSGESESPGVAGGRRDREGRRVCVSFGSRLRTSAGGSVWLLRDRVAVGVAPRALLLRRWVCSEAIVIVIADVAIFVRDSARADAGRYQ